MPLSVRRENFDQWMLPVYAPVPFIPPVRGVGFRLWDQHGVEYINLAGDIATNALAQAHPRLCQVLSERALFCNSGAEANEAALTISKGEVHSGLARFARACEKFVRGSLS